MSITFQSRKPELLVRDRPVATGHIEKQSVGVQELLEWAFAQEHAGLTFDDFGAVLPLVIGNSYMIAQHEKLGARIDTSPGRSIPADDAEIVASIVAALPSAHGGKTMAAYIADLSRTSRAPDWIEDAKPKCIPKGWRQCKHGRYAVTENVGTFKVRNRRGIEVSRKVMACPVSFRPSASEVAAARRNYLRWWGALCDISATLRAMELQYFRVTRDLPPREPWKSS